jgi:hypothetical protein
MGKRQGWEAESTEEQRKYMRMRMYSLLWRKQWLNKFPHSWISTKYLTYMWIGYVSYCIQCGCEKYKIHIIGQNQNDWQWETNAWKLLSCIGLKLGDIFLSKSTEMELRWTNSHHNIGFCKYHVPSPSFSTSHIRVLQGPILEECRTSAGDEF